MTETADLTSKNTLDRPSENGGDRPGFTSMIPGLDLPRPKPGRLAEIVSASVEARRESGIISDLDSGLVSLVVADAMKLDASIGRSKPSGRAKLVQAMSDALESLPAPEAAGSSLLQAYLSALLGDGTTDDEDDDRRPLPDLPELDESAGVTETGIHRTLVARREAGLSTLEFAAHEELALTTARDLDRSLHIGAESGYALLASVMQTLLERLPRPEATVTDQERVDQLLASVVDDTPSPWKHLPEAAHHPERDPSYLTEVDEICAVARAMGRHLMPWQYKALEVGTEYRLDSFGLRRYHYGTVLITVPRQSGKTDLTVPLQVHRALTRTDPAAVWYTAQTGQDARKRMMEFLERVEESLLQLLLSSSRSNGAEGVKVRGKPGAHVTRFSPTFSALHGEHPHLVTMDEVWHFTKELGDALIGAIEPSQITLGSRAQMWLVSTMGTVASEWMNDYVDHGRAGDNPDLCYIEYSIPDGADPFDPKSWWMFHPALGNTIAEEDLAKRARSAQESAARRATWLRAYCNTLVASDGTLVDLAVWDDLAIDVEPPENTSEITLGIEVAPRNAAAAVTAAWTDARTGRPCVRIVHQAPGTSWLVPYVDDLAGKWGSLLAADSAGPSSRFVKALEDLGHDIRTLSMAEYGQATEALLDYAGADEVLIHDGSDELRAQMAGAEVRRSNGVRRFSRDGSVPTPALIGGAVALYAHEHPEVPTQTLLI